MKETFTLTKKKIIVSAKIKGIIKERNFDFILDTGSSKSIIDSNVAFALGFDLQKLETERLMTISGVTVSKTFFLFLFL
jgi:predicted aspartyl protease